MKILVTGAQGFIGKNLCFNLRCKTDYTIYECSKSTPKELLEQYVKDCDFIFHLAGANRPKNTVEFYKTNFDFTKELVEMLIEHKNKCPIVISSSIQANDDNDYGKSKKMAEDFLIKYGQEHNVKIYIYRLPNVYGKWSKPNYNSVIATFCYNVSRNIDITITDREKVISLVYIDDVIDAFIKTINDNIFLDQYGYCQINRIDKITLGEIADKIYEFKQSRSNLMISDMGDPFFKNLYSTYLSYLSVDNFSYPLDMHVDNRGSFTEFLRTTNFGQVSINIAKPNIVKGNHWHNTKNEKFLVVKGKGIIRFRQIGTKEIIEYHVDGDNLKVIDIPCGYTHNIENIGTQDMVTIMWANEMFDKDAPDTYYEEV